MGIGLLEGDLKETQMASKKLAIMNAIMSLLYIELNTAIVDSPVTAFVYK